MTNYNNEFIENISSLNRFSKRTIAIITDIALSILCTWLAFIIRLEELILLKDFNFYPAIISIIFLVPIYWLFGLYRTIFRYTGMSILFTILVSTFIYGLSFFLVIGVYGIQGVPRSIGVLQPMLLFFAIIMSRLVVKVVMFNNKDSRKLSKKKNVLIYGSGEAGRQVVTALENSLEFNVIGFLDDNKDLNKQVILGKTIYSPKYLEKLVKAKDIVLVFLALPSISRSQRNKIIERLNKQKVIVKTLPSISEIVDGRITISDIKDLNIEDLLNRKQIEPDINLLNKNINSKTVLVTGAGGSIGSELCRQIIKLEANKLVLLELNEYALYKIYEELKNYKNKNLKIIPLLMNAQNQSKIEKILQTFNVDTVYHAAAYKHVSLVEENICEGVKNNVFSTLAIARASISKKVSNLVLISSDKAVRPTNAMGASKRLAELCMQGLFDHTRDNGTQFSIVRFGNVLDSSGSVIPKFKKQIKDGGPVSLTHKDVTRYFMTIPEAAQLVIQAGAMGGNSEVFVLDMGESVKIRELIYKMINLSGLSIKDINNPLGDIEIQITGLRPGEKLYEELLIGDNPQQTNHPKILRATDPFISFDKLELELNILKDLLDNNETIKVRNLLVNLLKSYKTNSEIVDRIYLEQISSNKNPKKLSLIKKKDDHNINLSKRVFTNKRI
jgi:FlaA1/EpsC-like NDP-sugar epimerase